MSLDAWTVSPSAVDAAPGGASALCLALPAGDTGDRYAAAIARHPHASVFAIRGASPWVESGLAWRGAGGATRAVGWTLGGDPEAATRAAALRLRAIRDLRTRAFALVAIAADGRAATAVAGTLSAHLGACALVGGVVAGDDAAVYVDGEPRADAVALLLVETALPFSTFVEEPYVPVGRPLVVTGAAEGGFALTRLDGRPAAAVYAEALAAVGADLAAAADHPLWVQVRGQGFARRVLGVDGSGGLRLAAGVEPGVVVRLAQRRPVQAEGCDAGARGAVGRDAWTFAFRGVERAAPRSNAFAVATCGELTGGLFRSGACVGLAWGAEP